MPEERRLTMRQLRQLLRLARGRHERSRHCRRMLGIARSTVQDNLKRAEQAGLELAIARRAD